MSSCVGAARVSLRCCSVWFGIVCLPVSLSSSCRVVVVSSSCRRVCRVADALRMRRVWWVGEDTRGSRAGGLVCRNVFYPPLSPSPQSPHLPHQISRPPKHPRIAPNSSQRLKRPIHHLKLGSLRMDSMEPHIKLLDMVRGLLMKHSPVLYDICSCRQDIYGN